MNASSHPIKVGLVGCGQATTISHLPALRHVAEIEVVALADVDSDRLERVADRFRIEHRYTSHAALLDDETIEAVGVCVPAEHHVEVGSAVLDAGKHLFLEKPIAVSSSEAERLIECASLSSRKVLLGFNLRWHRLAQQARDLLEQGVLGPLTLLRAQLTSHHEAIPEWRKRRASGGGVFFEQAVHHFDLWRFLLRSEIEEVFAVSRSGAWEDEAAALTARMSNGVLVSAIFDVHSTSRNELELYGKAGSLAFSFYRFDSLVRTAATDPTDGIKTRLRELANVVREAPRGVLRLRNGGDFIASYQAEWRHFVDAIRHDVPIQCTLEDGRRALDVVLAAARSACSGRPVKIAEVWK